MKLYRYLSRLQSTIYSRREKVERLVTHLTTALNGQIWGRLRFYDGSLLEFEEKLTLHDDDIEKIDYRYHYQRADGTLCATTMLRIILGCLTFQIISTRRPALNPPNRRI